MDPNRKITKKFAKKFGSKVIKNNIFIERLGFTNMYLGVLFVIFRL